MTTNIDRDIPDQAAVLDVRNLTVTYDTEGGPLHTVRDVTLQIAAGETYGLVGESGSGKTTLASAIVRYLPGNGRITGGRVMLDGVNLLDLSREQMRGIWGAKISLVHQDPSAAVNPSIVVGEQIAEVARRHLGLSGQAAWAMAIEMLEKVRMPDPETMARRYAHQLSGGQLQRVLIATALTTNPRLLIMDEPTTALDVTTEAVILDLVRDLLAEYRGGVLYITHNLGVVARICHRVGVIYAGELMEQGSIRQVFSEPLHPYTLALLGCVPRVDVSKSDIALNTIPGFIPRPDRLPTGCIFAPRCTMAEEACRQARAPLVEAEAGHWTSCRCWQEMRAAPQVFAAPRKARDYARRREGPVVLQASHVKKFFKASGLGLSSFWNFKRPIVHAVDDMSVKVRGSFTMGLVGESGCGKTTFARCIAGLEEANSGDIELEGTRLPYSVSKRPPALLKKIQMVFQNPDASLNPHFTVGESVARPLKLLGNLSKEEVDRRVLELFRAVNLPEDYVRRLPHELSGGEKQRVAIARACASDPTVLICDEPISSLDVSVQASLMNLLVELQESKGTSYLFISHDLAAVRHLSDWIAVVYLGRICEMGSAHDVFAPPHHPYTEALLSAIPVPDPDVLSSGLRLEGTVPSAVDIPSGCRFHARCPWMIEGLCDDKEPPAREAPNYHQIWCHNRIERLKQIQGSRVGPARGEGEVG